MRALRGLFCAVAVSACLAPGAARADEFNKQTYLTFSGPVQLPGITLAAGTYEFKLADPESGRSLVQVWDKDGSKLITTLLTIPDQRMKPSEDPVVTFGERPSGEPMPIRSWFYPTDTYGQEFVYPKDQAMRIAKDTHSSVLAFNDETKDAAEYKSAKIGRMDENGHMNSSQSASTGSTTTSGAASTTADERSNPAAQSSTAQSDASLSRPARSVSGQPAESSPSTAVGTSGTATTAPAAADTTSEANRDNIPSNRAVGTSGTTADTAGANRTAQAAAGANAAAPRTNANNQPAPATGATGNPRTLPHTAGSMTLVELLAGLSLAAAFGLHTVRARSAHTR